MNKTTQTSRYNASDYLKTPADRESYLQAAFADGDPQVITRALGDVAKAQNVTQLAKNAQINRAHLYRALSNKGDPHLSTLSKIIKALGYKLDITKSASPQLS